MGELRRADRHRAAAGLGLGPNARPRAAPRPAPGRPGAAADPAAGCRADPLGDILAARPRAGLPGAAGRATGRLRRIRRRAGAGRPDGPDGGRGHGGVGTSDRRPDAPVRQPAGLATGWLAPERADGAADRTARSGWSATARPAPGAPSAEPRPHRLRDRRARRRRARPRRAGLRERADRARPATGSGRPWRSSRRRSIGPPTRSTTRRPPRRRSRSRSTGPGGGVGRGGHDHRRADQPRDAGERAADRQHPRDLTPLGTAGDAVGGIANSIEGLDSRLTAIADGLAGNEDALAANATSLGLSSATAWTRWPSGCAPASSRTRWPTSGLVIAADAAGADGLDGRAGDRGARLRAVAAARARADRIVSPRSCRKRRARGARAPAMPWTPPPGGVDDEQRYRPVPTRYGSSAGHGRKSELADVLDAAVDVAADIVRVVRLHRCRPMDGAGQDPVAEARARSARPGPRSARSCPPSSPPARGSTPRPSSCRPAPASVSHGSVLDEQHVRPFGVAAGGDVRLARRRSRRASRRGGPSPPGAAPSAAHGTGPSSAQSTLNTPGP